MKKEDLLKALLVLLQFVLLGILFCIVFAFSMIMCSCGTPKTTIQDEWYFDYDEVVDIDINEPNDIIFTKLGIEDKYEFCQKHTQAKVKEGIFPVISTLDGLSEVVEALFREIQKQNPDFLHKVSVNTNLTTKKCTYKLKFSN